MNLVFDMDGTIADLYGYENWLPLLREENPIPYENCSPIYDMEILNDILNRLKACGFRVVVVSWLAMGSSRTYNKAVRQAKRNWLSKYNFPYDEIHLVKYGTPKHYVFKKEDSILIDDNLDVLNAWTRGSIINAKFDIIPQLLALLEE